MESKNTDKSISSGRFQPGEETFEDTEGHAFRGGALPEEADTEGHRFSGGARPAEDEDVDGHRFHGTARPDDDEDTEGHIAGAGG